LFESGEIMNLRENVIRPFYKKKSEFAAQLAEELFKDLPVKIHKPEGAFFLWFWFQDLPISTTELYKRLAERDVYIIPSEYFYPEQDPNYKHQTECIRVTYTQANDILEKGFKIIAEEVQKSYKA